MQSATASKPFTGVPPSNVPAIDQETGFFNILWQRFFVDLWKKAGQGFNSTAKAVFLQLTATTLQAVDSITGQVLGTVALVNPVGLPPIVVAVGPSPFVYAPVSQGSLVVAGGGQVEINRGVAGWITIGLVGGIIPMLRNDQVRVTWFAGPAPTLTFLPTA